MEMNKEKSLYERLGGYNAIAAVVDDFISRWVADPHIGRFLIGHSTDSKKRMRQQLVELVCEAAGGPCIYTGRNMRTKV
jgi:hemoglobin